MGSLTYDNALNTLIMEYTYYKSDSNEKLIAQTMLKNIRKISDYTIEQTAECCNFSVSTCRRFIRQLGYNSYSEFRMHLKANIENIDIEFPLKSTKTLRKTHLILKIMSRCLKGIWSRSYNVSTKILWYRPPGSSMNMNIFLSMIC